MFFYIKMTLRVQFYDLYFQILGLHCSFGYYFKLYQSIDFCLVLKTYKINMYERV